MRDLGTSWLLRPALASMTAAASVALPGCSEPSEKGCPAGWEAAESIDLNTSVDLHAVEQLFDDDGPPTYAGIAVGAEGTIVVWGYDEGDFVEVSSIGTVDLRAISALHGSWWVVGDGGTAAVSGDAGQTWLPVDLPTTANLRAITQIGSQLLIVGDEVVLIQNADGTWDEVAAPEGGWGQLRGLYRGESLLWAVGLGGVIWSTTDPHGEWVAEPSGTQADLLAVDGPTAVAVGTDGTMLIRTASGWQRVDSDVSVDLVDYGYGHALGANGELFDVDEDGKLSRIDTLVGARALDSESEDTLAAVGDHGAAFSKYYFTCQ